MAHVVVVLRFLWQVAAGIFGFLVIEVATTVGFSPLGNIIQISAPFRIHLLATVVAVMSGLLGGGTATLAGGGGSRVPVIVAAAIVTVESAYILAYQRGANPFWFEFFGAATLLGATIAGGLLVRRTALEWRDRGAPRRLDERN